MHEGIAPVTSHVSCCQIGIDYCAVLAPFLRKHSVQTRLLYSSMQTLTRTSVHHLPSIFSFTTCCFFYMLGRSWSQVRACRGHMRAHRARSASCAHRQSRDAPSRCGCCAGRAPSQLCAAASYTTQAPPAAPLPSPGACEACMHPHGPHMKERNACSSTPHNLGDRASACRHRNGNMLGNPQYAANSSCVHALSFSTSRPHS